MGKTITTTRKELLTLIQGLKIYNRPYSSFSLKGYANLSVLLVVVDSKEKKRICDYIITEDDEEEIIIPEKSIFYAIAKYEEHKDNPHIQHAMSASIRGKLKLDADGVLKIYEISERKFFINKHRFTNKESRISIFGVTNVTDDVPRNKIANSNSIGGKVKTPKFFHTVRSTNFDPYNTAAEYIESCLN